MEQFIGIFLLIALVLLVAYFVPSVVKHHDATANSGYDEKFSTSLSVLKGINQQLKHSRKRENQKVNSAEVLRAKPSHVVKAPSKQRIVRTGMVMNMRPAVAITPQNLAHNEKVLRNVQFKNTMADAEFAKTKILVGNFRPSEKATNHRVHSVLQEQLNETENLVKRLDQEFEYVSGFKERYYRETGS